MHCNGQSRLKSKKASVTNLIECLMKNYSLSKLSTTIAPIDAGMEIMITLFNATSEFDNNGSLLMQNSTSITTMAVIKYAINMRRMNTILRLEILR